MRLKFVPIFYGIRVSLTFTADAPSLRRRTFRNIDVDTGGREGGSEWRFWLVIDGDEVVVAVWLLLAG